MNDEQVVWLRANAIPFRLDDSSDDFEDLERLKALIGNARIVQLGEQSHGDGSCFEAKVRLVKFLHQEMGFDVLAFESGLYDCWKADEDFLKQAKRDPDEKEATPLQSAQNGVFGIWTGCGQLSPLWEYLDEHATDERRLELAGFDCQFTASASSEYVDNVIATAKKYKIDLEALNVDEGFLDQLRQLANSEPFEGKKKKWLDTLDGLILAFDHARAPQSNDERELLMWRQLVRSLRAYANYSIPDAKDRAGEAANQSLNARDAQMAENLIWLAEQRYSDRKIIVWAASFHIMRNASEIEVPSKVVDYTDIVPMGHLVDNKFGNDVYTIGFTAGGGKAGTWFRPAVELDSPPEGTLEDLCIRAEIENGLIPLKRSAARNAERPVDLPKWLTEKTFARPLGYSWMKASWNRHFDALIFQHEMRPANSVR